MKGNVRGGKMGKYPKGPISQHKSLATGAAIQTANKADKGGEFDTCGPGAKSPSMGKGGTISSSGDTGGPRGGKIPASKMTPA